MDEDTQDAAEHQQQQDEQRHRELTGFDLLMSREHSERMARNKAEQTQLKQLCWALDRIFDHG